MLSDITLCVASIFLGLCRVRSESSVRDRFIIRLQFLASTFSLVSNCWTVFFRESQIVYAFVLVLCDLQLILGYPPLKWCAVAVSLFLLILLSLCGIPFFHVVGLVVGYVAGLLNIFLFGVALAFPGREPLREPSLGLVCASVYMLMLFNEKEDDLYASHWELIRWYGSTAATMALNGIGIGRGGAF